MGLFKKLGGLISNPIRGIGRIARGHIREGLRDIAGTAKFVAPLVGGPLGIAASAAAGGLAAKKHSGIGGFLKGAAVGAGTAAAGQFIKGKFGGGGGGAPATASSAPADTRVFDAVMSAPRQAAGVTPINATTATRGLGIGRALAPAAKTAGKLATAGKAARDFAPLAGVGAQAYGAYKTGQAEDKELEFQQGQVTRQNTIEDDERERRRKIIDGILANRQQMRAAGTL